MRAAIKIKVLLAFFVCNTLSSCGVYRSGFQCRAGKGIGCAPIGEVLNLIVEREQGEDLFVLNREEALLLNHKEKEKLSSEKTKLNENYTLILVKDETGRFILVQEEEKSSYANH